MTLSLNYLNLSHIPLLKELGSSMSDSVFLMKVSDQNFIYDYMNEAGFELARLNPTSLGKSLQECLPESEAAFLTDQYSKVLLLQQKISYHDTVVFPNVQYLAETTLYPLFNNGLEVSYVFAITKNISIHTMNSPEVRQLNRIFSSYLENTEEAFALFDLNWNFLRINESFYRLFGYKKSEIYNLNWFDIQPKLKLRFMELYELLKQGEKLKRFDQDLAGKNGQQLIASIGLTAIADENGALIRIVMTLEDITEKIHTKKQLEKSEERYRLIADHSQDLIKILTKDGFIQYASPSHKQVLGYHPKELNGIHYSEFVDERDYNTIERNSISQLQFSKELRYEVRLKNKNNKPLWVETRLTPVKDNQGHYRKVVASSRDITKRKLAEEQLKRMAYTDSLTGLTNRRVFEDSLTQAAENKLTSKFALLFLDGDQFKTINDEYGHNVGDELLIIIGRRLKRAVRDGDIVARMGGDEYAVLLKNISSSLDIEEVAKRIISNLHRPFLIQGRTFSFTCSIGISVFPEDAVKITQIKKKADLALYEAKKKGKSQHVFYSSLKSKNQHR
ncbi:diguanylate cyclase domain-containing protein [Halobacillus sp. Marseille-P3879]|uniref:diguanylate cyclase domain-containing protein n=1 Tax=Halobacillus sp. Marseille-P3879 TaxID=2045014 RepID=UPI000C7CA5AC|nr:diguanylate cyclase [Halobacillus sp. Marseille-P3879]